MVRTREENDVEELRQAGATEVVPEVLEAALMIAAHALLLLDVPINRIVRRLQQQRTDRYPLLRELYRGTEMLTEDTDLLTAEGLRSIPVTTNSPAQGKKLSQFKLQDVSVSSLVRQGRREPEPLETVMTEGDVVVLFGSPSNLDRAERILLGSQIRKNES